MRIAFGGEGVLGRFGGVGVVLKGVFCRFGGSWRRWGCWGIFKWCLGCFEGVVGGVLGVLGRFMGCWGHLGVLGAFGGITIHGSILCSIANV